MENNRKITSSTKYNDKESIHFVHHNQFESRLLLIQSIIYIFVKQFWKRTAEYVKLEEEDVENMFPNIIDGNYRVELINHGLQNTNYKVLKPNNSYVIRIMKNPLKYDIETRLLPRLEKCPSVPKILDTYCDQHIKSYITNYLEGKHYHQLDKNNEDFSKEKLFYSVGSDLGKIHSITFNKSGFFDRNLNVDIMMEIDTFSYEKIARDLVTPFVQTHMMGMTTDIFNTIPKHIKLLENLDKTPRLIHGDYNFPNLLISNNQVSGILDWEFAFVGNPFHDLGNILRTENDLHANHVNQLIKGYQHTSGKELPESWRILIRLFDLLAIFTMLDKPKLPSNTKKDLLNITKRYIRELK